MFQRRQADIRQPAEGRAAFKVRAHHPRADAMLEHDGELPRRSGSGREKIILAAQSIDLDGIAAGEVQFQIRAPDEVLRIRNGLRLDHFERIRRWDP